MAVKKNPKSKLWGYDVRHPVTKNRIRVFKFKTKSEAEEAISVVQSRWRSQQFGITSPTALLGSKLKVRDELLTEASILQSEVGDWFTKTKYRNAKQIEKYAVLFPASLRVIDFATEHLLAVVLYERNRGTSENSITTYVNVLRGVLRRIKKRTKLDDWKLPSIELPRVSAAGSRRSRVWNQDDFNRLIEVLEHPEKHTASRGKQSDVRDSWYATRDAVLIASMCGARRTEVLTLEWKHVYFDFRVIRIRTLKRKTLEPVYRDIPLTDEMASLLRDRRARIVQRYGEQEVLVFPQWRRSQNSEWLRRTLQSACKVAGVPYGRGEGIVFHGLRHTAATKMISNGADIKTASDVLGNSVITMMQTYAHTSMDSKRRAMSSLTQDVSRQEDRKSG
jgi:integrase